MTQNAMTVKSGKSFLLREKRGSSSGGLVIAFSVKVGYTIIEIWKANYRNGFSSS